MYIFIYTYVYIYVFFLLVSDIYSPIDVYIYFM